MKAHPFPIRTFCLFLFVVALILVSFFLWEEPINRFVLGAVGATQKCKLLIAAVLFAALGSDILLPLPSCIASMFCGLYLGAFWGFWVSFLAMQFSATLGYFLGYCFAPWAQKRIGENELESLRYFENVTGRWLVLMMRPVPILAEASVVFAGIGRQPKKHAFLQITLGNAVVSVIYALIGAYSKSTSDSFVPAFIGVVVLSGIFMLVPKLMRLKKGQA